MLRREYLLVFLSPLVLVAIGVGYVQASRNAGTRRAEDVPGEALYAEVLQTVRERYVVAPDEERLVYGAARGIMAELDRHSRIYDDGEWSDQNLRSAGKYAGIGILVGKLRGPLSVLEAMPRGPAARSGIRHGDRILAIDGEPVDDARPLSDYSGQLRGSVGSDVVLTVAALGTTTERAVEIRRGLTPERLVYGYVLEADPRIGYVNIESFRETTVALFDEEVEELLSAGAESLIMDLRGNLGGSLDAAIQLADRFISEACSWLPRGVCRRIRDTRVAPLPTPKFRSSSSSTGIQHPLPRSSRGRSRTTVAPCSSASVRSARASFRRCRRSVRGGREG